LTKLLSSGTIKIKKGRRNRGGHVAKNKPLPLFFAIGDKNEEVSYYDFVNR
jgi:hypothetical protein